MSKPLISKIEQRKIATKQINELFELALNSEEELTNRYVHLAKKISMKTRLSLPSVFKRSFCLKCDSKLLSNGRYRINNHKIVIYCPKCKNYQRIPLP